MINGLKSIRRERASLERDRVIMGSMMEDAETNDILFDTVDSTFLESVSEDEIEELIDKIPESDEEDEQVERVLRAPDTGLDADGILGIDNNE